MLDAVVRQKLFTSRRHKKRRGGKRARHEAKLKACKTIATYVRYLYAAVALC